MAIKASNQITITDITDAYTANLSSEAYVFTATETTVPANSTCSTTVSALHGNTSIMPAIDTSEIIFTAEGIIGNLNPNTTPKAPSITKNDDTTNKLSVLTFTLASGGTTVPIEATIPVHLDNDTVTITKKFTMGVSKQGNQGTPGQNGTSVTVSSTTYQYAKSTSGTTPPSSGWDSTPVAPTTTEYAWTKTTTTFSDNSTTVTYTVGGKVGQQGIQGPAGEDGTSSYFYVRYSKNASGNPMVVTPTSETQYMGVASTTSPTAPSSYSAYTWSKTKGEQGQQGVQGPAGEDGIPSYLHIKWSRDGVTFTPADEETGTPEGKTPDKWQGTYTDNNPVDSNVFSDYTWNDTSIYVQDSLNQLDSKIDGVDGRIGDVETDLHNNYYTNQDVDSKIKGNTDKINSIVDKVATLELDKGEFDVNVQRVINDYGVSKIETTTGYRFDENGLNISKTGSDIQNLLDNTGMYVNHSGVEMLGIDSTGGRMENLTVRKYLTMGDNSRFENYQGTRTGCFYTGGGS